MANPSKAHYLEGRILTASQPQLQLMLLDGALRFGRQANQLWTTGGEFVEIDAHLVRMADVLEELTNGAAEGETEISSQLEELYAFTYRELAACRINQDAGKLESCLRLLEYERETWKLACEKLTSEASAPKPRLPHLSTDSLPSSSGFSLEA